ncbi:hypothetical protein [Streptomyces rishiriensis]|uniref:Uncharacterized protein n=1 Tax=Streptomyces rishiriensis TaxID=68264 RepID=A0ABU0NSU9_STRRH|nr:hypothetical protein [Streptomyces rishiriensis]MDQ0582184.1 hypothetical protein [Streptomyces rishiriensis]
MTDLRRHENLTLVESSAATFNEREALLWQERRALYIRFLVIVDDWLGVLKDARDHGGVASSLGSQPIRTSEDARQASPFASAHIDASQAFAKGNTEMTVLAGTPVLSVLSDLRDVLYAAAAAALEGTDQLPAVYEQRGRLVQTMRYELTTSFVGDRHAVNRQ